MQLRISHLYQLEMILNYVYKSKLHYQNNHTCGLASFLSYEYFLGLLKLPKSDKKRNNCADWEV